MQSPLENQFTEVRSFVEAARFEEAIDCLAKSEGFQSHASVLRSRLSRIQDQDRKGQLTHNEVETEYNRLTYDILGLISEDFTSFAEDQETLQSPYAHLRPVLKEPPFILPQLDIPSFTGRREELHQLESAIFNTAGLRLAGIAGLTGAGGMGKSVLAFHFATIYRDRFPDGVIGLRVDGGDPEILAQRFASYTGTTIPTGQELTASEIMQSVFQNKQALLIFDNAEDGAVKLLRPGGNRCAVIVTTRNKGLLKNLEIPEAGHIDLTPFTFEEMCELLGNLIGNQRIASEPEAAKRIYDLVGGLPLAIRIVGGALDDQPFTTLAEFAQLLAGEKARLELLRDPDDPDLNVAASFELSLNRLESLKETEVIRVFACLGACPSKGFSLLAAQVVSEQDEITIKRILGRLVRLSLVNRGDQADEFTLHPLLFLFARRKAEYYGWLSDAEQRHTYFFLSYVRDHGVPSSDNFKALEVELKSLLLAGRRLATNQQPNYGFYIALEPFLEANGHWSQALDLIDLFSAAARDNADFSAMAQFSLQRGQFLQLRGKFEEAKACFLESEGLAIQIKSDHRRQRTQAMVLNSLGGVYQRQGNFTQAISAFEQSKSILEKLGDERGVAMVLNSLGGVYQRVEKYTEAIAALRQSADIERKYNNLRGLAMTLNSLSGAYRKRKWQESSFEAISVLKESEEIEKKLGNRRGHAMVLNSLGDVYQRLRDFDQAITVLQKSYDISVSLNDTRGQAMVLTSLGGVFQQKGDLGAAVRAFEQSADIEERFGNQRGQAMVLCAWGKALLNHKDPRQAAEKLKLSFKIDESLLNAKGLRVVTPSLVRSLTILGRRGEAQNYVDRALAISPTDRRLLSLQRQLAESHPVSSRAMIKTGTVKRLIRNPSGYLYGFIATEDESKDIYFGEESITKNLLLNLTEGTRVMAEVELSARGPRARNVWQDNNPPGNS